MTLEEKIVRDIEKYGYHRNYFNGNEFIQHPLLMNELCNLKLAGFNKKNLDKLTMMVQSRNSNDVELAKVYINELRNERLRRARNSKVK